MGAKGQLCKEHRFWHGELASCKDIITISEILGCYFECGNVLWHTGHTGPLVGIGITTRGPVLFMFGVISNLVC